MQVTQDIVETWLPVVGYEGYYEVSNRGLVRSLTRQVVRSDGRRSTHQGRPRRARPDVDGYMTLTLRRDGTIRYFGVHRLMMAAFVGPPPAGQEVCHNNGHPADNRLENLRYDTSSANKLDRRKHGTAFTRRNESECCHGHSWTEPNAVYVRSSGDRVCRECVRQRRRRYVARKRAEIEAQQLAA